MLELPVRPVRTDMKQLQTDVPSIVSTPSRSQAQHPGGVRPSHRGGPWAAAYDRAFVPGGRIPIGQAFAASVAEQILSEKTVAAPPGS